MADTTTFRRRIGVLRIFAIILVVAFIALAIAFAVVVVHLNKKIADLSDPEPETCTAGNQRMNLDPPQVLPPFHDLTAEEIMNVKEFLYGEKDINLSRPPDLPINSSYIFTMEIHVPEKEQTLNFLDRGQQQPPREAKVYVFRGDLQAPLVQEYIVGPLPRPTYKRDAGTRPFTVRPLTGPELYGMSVFIKLNVHYTCMDLLEESYGGKLLECGDRCLEFAFVTAYSPAVSGSSGSRKFWWWLMNDVEYPNLHTLDFQVLIDVTSRHIEQYSIEKVYHAGQTFNSLQDLAQAYKAGSFTKTKVPFPTVDENTFSTMNRRGTLFPEEPLSPPLEYEPDGRRYSIVGRHISYLGWEFDVRMSTVSGPQLFDIRYQKERIVYELSLQEVSVLYSANNPANRFSDFLDSIAMIGSRARSLVEGGDCPRHATYLSADHVIDYKTEPVHIDRAFCVYEHNTGTPFRRHLSSPPSRNQFYEGMLDTVLVVRSIATISNYDYIFDFIFHQNGAIEVKVIPTGFIVTSFRSPAEDDYGFRVRDTLTGTIHLHLFNFKADIDIKGKENRFETLDLKPVQVDNSEWSPQPGATYSQTRMERNLVRNESAAAIKHNFDQPSYLTFYSNNSISPTGVPRAYRLLINGVTKQLQAKGQGNEPSVAWARYQLAVTKYKENERKSSSMYSSFDADNQVVDFQGFIDDDENIVDEDQVAWITMGVHHIPHMEDFPVTPTVGLHLQFFLLPYNYFDEDPGMGSSDAVRINLRTQSDVKDGVTINRYGKKQNNQCVPPPSTFDDSVLSKPWSLFDES